MRITYGGSRKLCATCASLPSNQNMVAWLNLDSLQRTLAAQGVKVQQEKKQTVLTFPGIPTKAYLPLSEWYAARGQRYTPTWSLIWGLIGTNAARVSGFDNPVFILGKVALQLGDGSHTLSGYTAWDGPVLWTKLIRVPFQGECTAVVAACVAVRSAVNSSGVRYPNEECGRMPL